MSYREPSFIRGAVRAARSSPRIAFLVSLAALAFGALFVVSWLIFMPVAALVVAPATMLLSFLWGTPPSLLFNAVAAIVLSGGFAGGTVAAIFRVLRRRAQARRHAAA